MKDGWFKRIYPAKQVRGFGVERNLQLVKHGDHDDRILSRWRSKRKHGHHSFDEPFLQLPPTQQTLISMLLSIPNAVTLDDPIIIRVALHRSNVFAVWNVRYFW
ncbi:hypothetical protein CIRG_06055 [Coccidioides immitis RMSCC 2394]|uniref:Uncharacterized protein n=1 Tax=Coccidioides immitis RMSCC 2394 TaxID=404692 RepID=A0A0J6YFB2_COCIT|nr:hypothetical protein CIRG_06055 [Coccidioides immitis RMSCC 2394]